MEVQRRCISHRDNRGAPDGGLDCLSKAWNASGDTQEALKGEALVWRSLSILLKQVGDQRRNN